MAGITRDKTPLPVFVKSERLPNDISVYDICSAAEKVSGPITIDGAICISGLWRISPLYEASRIKLLASGINIRGRNVQLENINPFTMRSGDESSGTKLFIGNLPFSYSTEAIKNHLRVAGITLRSEVVWERARGPDGSLSDWKTGRRMVWINIPQRPLNKYLKMGNGFSATLYHKEMKQVAKCHKCLEVGHIAKNCDREVVCITCKKPGHRRGDPVCDLGISSQIEVSETAGESDSEKDDIPKSDEDDSESSESDKEDGELISSDSEDLTDEDTVGRKDVENEAQNNLEEEVSPADTDEVRNEEIQPEKEEGPDDKEEEVSKNSAETEQQKAQKNDEPPEEIQGTPNHPKAGEKKVKTKAESKSKDRTGKKKGTKDKNKSQSTGTFKQCQITEFTPGGKRNSEDMISPDNVEKGPQMKKINFDNS